MADAIDRDRAELEELKQRYKTASIKLRDFTIERNGNGRDYDVVPAFTGANGHGYTIAVKIVRDDGVAVVIIRTATTSIHAARCASSYGSR